MREPDHFSDHSEDAEDNDFVEQDDIRQVLSALGNLIEKTHHPIVRTCLEQAHEDILHLTSHGGEARDDDEGEPAAA